MRSSPYCSVTVTWWTLFVAILIIQPIVIHPPERGAVRDEFVGSSSNLCDVLADACDGVQYSCRCLRSYLAVMTEYNFLTCHRNV